MNPGAQPLVTPPAGLLDLIAHAGIDISGSRDRRPWLQYVQARRPPTGSGAEVHAEHADDRAGDIHLPRSSASAPAKDCESGHEVVSAGRHEVFARRPGRGLRCLRQAGTE
jgi:hypothetical protein